MNFTEKLPGSGESLGIRIASCFLHAVASATDNAILPAQCTPGTSVFVHPAWLCRVFENFEIPDGYCGQPELFRSPLLYLRRWTWGPIVPQPLLILLVMLDPGTAHPVFSLDAPRKVG